jgi:threonine-phosphate decarboxylase
MLYEHLSHNMATISSYPAPEADELELLIANKEAVNKENVVIGAGATELIYMTAQLFQGETYCISEPTFCEYERACETNSMKRGTQGGARLQWICNPNNPDGKVIPKADLLQAIDNAPQTMFVIDASYEDYTMKEMPSTQEMLERANVIALHSMTKRYCIPGLRIGYAVTTAETAGKLRAIRRPWSINAVAYEAVRFLIKNNVWVLPPTEDHLKETKRLQEAINCLPNYSADNTQTNFFLCKASTITARELKERLANEYGILIRDASDFPTLSPNHFRIAAQNKEDNDKLIKALSTI